MTAMAQGWSIAGRRIEFKAALPAGKVVVMEGGAVTHEQKLTQAGEWPLSVDGATFRLKRTRHFMGIKNELRDAQGALVPPTAKLVAQVAAASGSVCAAHQQPARYACARCGTFVCATCAGNDLTHCQPCCQRMTQDAAKNAAAMAYFAPVAILAILGGVLLALLGAAAGAGAVAIARRTQSRALKIAAAVGLYGIAVIIWLVIVAAITNK
jgi:hypothetical protein